MGDISAVITGTGSSLPEKIVTNFDLEKILDTSDEWITTRTGIRERHVATDSEYMSIFATDSSKKAIEMAGIPPSDIDMIICATVTPDMPIPSTACTIQENLKAKKASAFDLSAGCSGFIFALSIANQYILSGTHHNILVIGAELLTKYMDWSDRTTSVIFADGAGAVILSRGERPRGILASSLHTDGSMVDFLYVPAGGTISPPSQETVNKKMHYIKMKGNETFKIAVRSIEDVSREVIKQAGLMPQDIDWFIPHQANKRIIDAVGTRLNIDQKKIFINIDRIGNTSAASIPIALDEARRANMIKEGDNILFAAFGAGLTWAAALVKW
ncbi:MAG: beta-ketoacyl-ACP synthase III [Acidobacteriota bacterium]